MGEFGLKIRNLKASTVFGYNIGVRDRYDFTQAMFCNSLFSNFIRKNGLKDYKDEYTRDIVCFDFGFGSRSYEEEIDHLQKMRKEAEKNNNEQKLQVLNYLENKVESNKDNFKKMSKDELRYYFYENGIDITYDNINKRTGEITTETIHYVMLYRNPSKAKVGQVMFINEELYDIAYDWLTMGIKMPEDNAMIVEISAYAPLVTSTIVDTMHIPVEDILILKDIDSFFTTMADVITAEDYIDHNGRYKKKCILNKKETQVKNTLWDGMALIEKSILPQSVNGMALLRNHFFKVCGINSNIQLFFKDWCEKTGNDYDTYEVQDMFGNWLKLKNIKMITTDNAIKWKKFTKFLGGTLPEAYKYWCNRVNADGSIFGIVKTDHISKLGNVQQMSYQMVNTLPATKEDIFEIASTSVEYVNSLKNDPDVFEKFLRKNANAINHYEMLADLYDWNHDFKDSEYFRTEKRKIISEYVFKLRKGKITINGDNLTMFGNPYGLLLYSVGEFDIDKADSLGYDADPTLGYEQGVIQCYTKRFKHDEYLGAYRSPQNSPNNISYLHNRYSYEMDRYFNFSNNLIAVNCVHTDIQPRMNGADYVSWSVLWKHSSKDIW